MRIVFLLPTRSAGPSGGYKIVYEYANRLVANGHRVCVVHPWDCAPPQDVGAALRAGRWLARYRLRPRSLLPWFELDQRVSLRAVTYPRASALPDADALIATAWQTAAWVAGADSGSGKPFYLIQGYENWDDEDGVRATWRLPLHKIVVSGWLRDIAVEMGEDARTSLVRNGIDFDQFGVDVAPDERGIRVGALLSPFKRPGEVVEALSAARRQLPELAASVFGGPVRPPDLPDWVEYVSRPDPPALRALYNSCSIFLQASDQEGWGLPATESMACGCALVTYDNGGSREYAVDRSTAIVVRERSPAFLAEAIVGLARDRERRLRLSSQGRAKVEGFTWPRAVAGLEAVLGASATSGEGR